MVKQRETNAKRWGTLEELLLASAVNRHGTASWESVAMEIQNRCSQSPSSSSSSSSSLTPQDCRNKFYDLKRRFLSQNVIDSDSDTNTLMPMLDELRKIRVQELRRDVERRDVLIVSLEMKVKRLEEERDRSFNQSHEGSDLDTDKAKTNLHLQNPAASGDDSDDRENRSLNESNSTSKKDDVRQNGMVEENPIIESVNMSKIKETGPPKTGDEPGREWSFNSEGAEPEAKPEREKKSGGGYKRREKERNWGNWKGAAAAVDSNEAWESVSESKQDGKEGAVSKQQSSDVQSSGSLSQRKRCRNSSGEEPEVSPAKPKPKPLAVKSEPLLKLLDTIRSHQLGSTFERRLRSQESDRYKNLIRQHIDLRTIRCRVVKGAYADSIHRFFRDLLLLFNNAIIFFHRSSPENGAALKLRALVLKEMKDSIEKPQPVILKSKPKQETDLSLPSSKPTTKPSTTIVGCRKRDSVATDCKKADKNSRDVEVKPKVSDSSEIKIYEKGTWKKGSNSKERLRPTPTPTPVNSGQRSSRTSSTSKNNGEVKHEYGGNELSSHDGMEVRMEKKERVTKKKQGAVSFLKRMKQNSPNEAAEEDGDASENECIKEEEEEEEEEEQEEEEEGKRKVKKQKEGKKERVRRNGGGGGRGKKAVGRPPKKTETVTVKRQQREEVSSSKPQKRSRR
ncbi:transcriptional regulator ATRX-like [Cucumis melo var. makuwa]|uniref:Transcriptional regulator ATRX-like n=2 Tax=Cucumis melo TaxID=3656 RepID=A0A1S3BNE2_CUCME|nr:uncharacterized protein LOC103491536 [Cucumis melo]KAA0041385.1 transcriptional regulator ATRX-like [Cucumis melo var. makuwa]